MMNEKRVMRMEQIKEWAEEWGLSIKDAVYDLVFDFYETTGFRTDVLEKELSSKSEAELIEMFCAI